MKKIAAISQTLFLLFLTNQQALAIGVSINKPQALIGGTVDPTNVVSFILTVLVVIGVVASIAFIIHGGIRWSMSGGDKVAVEAARNQVVAAVVGLIVVLLSFVIIGFVLALIGAGTLPSIFVIPNLVSP